MVASHDLQEPLRKIRLFTDKVLTNDGLHLPEHARQDLERVSLAAGRMQLLVRAISEYPQATNGNFEQGSADLRVLLGSVKQDLWQELLQRDAALHFEGEPMVMGQAVQLRQLLFNLVHNALKFSSPRRPPSIRIVNRIVAGKDVLQAGLVPEAEYFHISVADNGIGFRPEYNEKVFQLFVRVHSTQHFPGNGVGLAVARRIVEHHRGRIFADGQEEEGARFDIYLPRTLPA
ncbi:MAG: hypothetical protein EOO11_22410 [Chitinophagaceae bacterium]|nr:MAG: hypothetical protein EOO11_22410 [Chitinophagaceae bacterium]